MLDIQEENIKITRGNMLPVTLIVKNEIDGSDYVFQPDDVIRIKIFERKNVSNVLLEKDFYPESETTELDIVLTADEMKIGELIDKSKEYWYEIELNPDTPYVQTIVGYNKTEEGEKPAILTLLPEGGDKND